MYLLGDHFLKYDYRHHITIIFQIKSKSTFKKTKFKIEKTMGFHDYDMNHLIEFSKTRKSVWKI